MAFYSYMMEKYSKSSKAQKLTKEERMNAAKAKIENSYQQSINGYLQFVKSMNSNFTNEEAISVYNLVDNQRAELKQMQPLSAKEYFTQLAHNEQNQLYDYISECKQDIREVNEQAEKLENNEGFASKFYNFTGLSNIKNSQYNEQIETLQGQIDVAKESFVEWAKMPEQQVDYVLARYEQEGITTLDVRNLTNYAIHHHEIQAPQADDACQQ